MKRSKGFTLVELLAVIVILAIIALIAVPTILGVIDKARVGAAKASALNYISAVEKYLILSQMDEENYPVKLENGKKYKISNENAQLSFVDYLVESVKAEEPGEIVLNDIIDIKGEKPTGGWLEIKNNKVSDYTLKVGDYAVNYDEKTNSSVVIKGGNLKEETEEKKFKDGTAVYFNPEINEICSADESISTTGTKTGCMKWYIFGDDSDTSVVNMILDHNTTPVILWNTDKNLVESNAAKIQLQKDIESWNDDIKSTARFIEADEIAAIVGANREDTLKWDSEKIENFNMDDDHNYLDVNIDTEISWFYLDGQGSTYDKSQNGWRLATAKSKGASKYAWLYDNLNGCTSYGCNIEDNDEYIYYNGTEYNENRKSDLWGYWTNTTLKSGIETGEDRNYVWVIEKRGSLSKTYTMYAEIGIRPVIAIDKEKLK